MSGLDGLGIALGVLPLLISAIEHYEDAFRPFRRYRDFAPELARFQRRLLAQKTIFHSQCQLLLLPLTDKKTITDVLNGQQTHSLASNELSTKLEDHLGRLAEACMATMIDIEEQLGNLQEKSKEFLPTESTSKRSWQKHFRKKFKFSISEPHIERCIGKLRDLNQDFSALAQKRSELFTASTAEKPFIESASAVKHYQFIQNTSVKFYEALRTACSTHEGHQAYLQVIQHSLAKPYQVAEEVNVQFRLGFSKAKRGGIIENCDTPVWLIVKSTLELSPESSVQIGRSLSDSDKEMSELCSALKRNSEFSSCGIQRRPKITSRVFKKKEHYPRRITPSKASVSPALNASNNSPHTKPNHQGVVDKATAMPNFCITKNLCANISWICKKPLTNSDACFGQLKNASTKHELYLENQEGFTQDCISLNKFMEAMAERHRLDQLERVPLLDRVLLARNLALAVLQFHGTPVLKPSWSGSDVILYGLETFNNSQSRNSVLITTERISDPFLKIHVDSEEPCPMVIDKSATKTEDKSIRNQYLFRLGVFLLELAYEALLYSINHKPKLNI